MNTQAAAPVRGSTTFTFLLAALAGLMFGLDVGVIGGAQQFIQHAFKLDDDAIGWIVSSMALGATLGAVVAGWVSATLGRKRTLIASAILFVFGSLFCGLAWTADVLAAARIVLGLAIGVAAFTAPLYLAEVAPKQRRGAMISTYQLMITIGILVAFLSDTAFSYSGNWRWMLGIIAVPGAMFLLGVLFLPESPRWLLLKGREDEARGVLTGLRGDPSRVDREVHEIQEQLKVPQRGWHLFLENRFFRRSVMLGIALQVAQQLTGINVVVYYAPKIFQNMGYSTEAQMWFTAIVGLTNLLSTFIAIGLVDRWGRKPILYTGGVIMALGLGLAGVFMTSHPLFAVVCLLAFIVGFAMSAGPLVWTLCSEIQPLKGRDFGIGVSTVTNWLATFVVTGTFPILLSQIGHAPTFWLYAAFNALFIVFTWWLVPETKGVSLEQIERNLMSGKRLRDIGQ